MSIPQRSRLIAQMAEQNRSSGTSAQRIDALAHDIAHEIELARSAGARPHDFLDGCTDHPGASHELICCACQVEQEAGDAIRAEADVVDAAEARIVHGHLDVLGIPRADQSGIVYSLLGRVEAALAATVT